MLWSAEDGPFLIGIDEIGDGVVDYAGGTGVDECFDATDLAGLFEKGFCARDVNFVEERVVCAVDLGGCGVDYNCGADFFKDFADGGGGGDVRIVIGGAWVAVGGCAEVEDRDFAGGGGEELGDYVVTEEAAAADYEDRGGELGGWV